MMLSAVLLVLTACENEKNTFSGNPSIYLGGDAEQEATADSVLFSFKKQDQSMTSHDLNLKVYTTGVPVDHNRTFEVEVVPEETNVSSSDYSIGKLEIPANAYYAVIPITVNRKIDHLDLSKETATLTLRVKANEFFSEGPEEKSRFKFVWCDYLTQPAWWTPYGFASYAGPFSQARYQFILDYYGDVDLFELGMVDPNSGYMSDSNKLYAFIAELIDLLNEYNATHEEPYLNDNGEPLKIGASLSN